MTGALVILSALVLIGIFLYIGELRRRKRVAKAAVVTVRQAVVEDSDSDATEDSGATEDMSGGECCGLHLVCEKDSLSPMSGDVEYYDDEELDRFIGRDGFDYTPDEIEEFRDVLMTLRPEDIPGWARSITVRHLNLPSDVRDELLLLINDQRNKK